ncbi:hypothetical protein [Geopseudomonas aromaticivorans]
MRADDWIKLGEALKANAETLEAMALADDTGLPAPDRPTKGMSWLLQKRLVDEDNDMLHLSSLLLDLGAQISLQGFERVAPDLKESLIAIEQLCEAYHAAKFDNALDDMERHYKRLTYTTRQVITHLRNELSTTRAFLESGYGYSTRLTDRLRDIKHVIGRLQRLHEKLSLFSHAGLLPLARSDRALRRLLLDNLLDAVSRNRLALDEMIGRLDRLSIAVRKRNRLRQVAQSVDLFLQSGNSVDLDPLLERADAAHWVLAAPQPMLGHPYSDESDAEGFMVLEELIASLPQPKERPAPVEQPKSREAVAVPPHSEALSAMEIPFAKPHLEAMLRELIATGEAQSSAAYWAEHGDPQVAVGIWLYALDGYVELQQAISQTQSKRLNYRLTPTFAPFNRSSANRLILDLELGRARQVR